MSNLYLLKSHSSPQNSGNLENRSGSFCENNENQPTTTKKMPKLVYEALLTTDKKKKINCNNFKKGVID